MSRAQRALALDALTPDSVFIVKLGPDDLGRPREALVLRDASGTPRAYLNRCRHLPIPLDAGSRSFLKQGALECATHGARYRLEDGLCVVGPCAGESLVQLGLLERDGVLYVLEPDGAGS